MQIALQVLIAARKCSLNLSETSCNTAAQIESVLNAADLLQEDSKRAKVLSRTTYYCCHGPEDHSHNIPAETEAHARSDGSRRKQTQWGGGIKRGCQASFTAAVYIAEPTIVELQYTQMEHVNKAGLPCHGEGSKVHVRYLSQEARSKVEERLLRQTIPQAIVRQIQNDSLQAYRLQRGLPSIHAAQTELMVSLLQRQLAFTPGIC